ncbi:hypothetical protein [Lentilactobacillus kisonensis]|uniref:Phage shock protein G domain protein n=2 Tax=Lentilactobacillus kisonensis TaxID=481722 RepID=H1LKX4_9LACO|nr:hypothetical protein [Lentilactobacillus kisonensis]EHO45890.1 phage shock protein G domain protein [Lentilactobacillus kisonensis F0435]KRL23568.1 phage shock protein G domain protein [Lentilactobacillus kisonensis DSM 19906 = JCM 15041]
MVKNQRVIFTGIAILVILSLAFYASQQINNSTLLFIGIWVIAIILIRLLLTPLVVWIVRARDAKKEQQAKNVATNQAPSKNHRSKNFDD